MTFRSERH